MNNISNLLDYFYIEEVEDEGADISWAYNLLRKEVLIYQANISCRVK